MLGVILFRIMLDVVYEQIINQYFHYAGFVNKQENFSLLKSWLLLLLLFPFVSKVLKKGLFSSNIIILLFLISYVPMTSLFRFIPPTSYFYIIFTLYWLTLFILYLVIPKISLKLPNFRKGMPAELWAVLLILCLSVLLVSGIYHGFRLTIDLSDVYTLRAEQRAAKYHAVFSYLLPAAGNILPVFLVYFLTKKNYKWSAFLAITIIFNFSTGGHKSILFKLILVFVGFVIFNYKTIYKYSWFLVSLLLAALVEFNFFNSIAISNFVIRRVMYIPGRLNYYYFDFFSKNPSDFYFQGFLGRLGFQSSYNKPLQRIIGENYYGTEAMNANNGLFSDAYANMNVYGVLFLPLILVIIFKLADSVSKGLDVRLLFLPTIAFVMSFNAGFFSSVLLTNGIALLMLSLFLYPRKRKQITKL